MHRGTAQIAQNPRNVVKNPEDLVEMNTFLP